MDDIDIPIDHGTKENEGLDLSRRNMVKLIGGAGARDTWTCMTGQGLFHSISWPISSRCT